MRLLLDSHVFLWLLFHPLRVRPHVQQALEAADSVTVSIVSLWELTLKHTKGKLPHGPQELSEGAEALRINVHPVRTDHIVLLPELRLEHKDPFDQLLIAQCQVDQLVLVTADTALLTSDYATLDAR